MKQHTKKNTHRVKKFQTCDIDHNFLSASILIPEPLETWIPPAELLSKPIPRVYIPKPKKKSICLKYDLETSLAKEMKSLMRYQEMKHEQLEIEKQTMKACDKDREDLLIRRHQVLPHITQPGKEKSVIEIDSYEEPELFPDWVLWAPIIFNMKEKNGIIRQMTKRERGFTKVPEWFGCPESLDIMRNKLGLNQQHVKSYLRQVNNENVCRNQTDCVCVPEFERLAVKGFNYKLLHESLRQPVKEELNVFAKSHVFSENVTRGKHISLLSKWKKLNQKIPFGRVSLSLAHLNFHWSSDSNKSQQTWVVELGSTAEIGERSIEWVLMRNTGTAAIHYHWVIMDKDEHDAVRKRSEPMKFIFDSCDGTILPGDVYRIPFQYRATSYGQFSEDWQLVTQPVLENGAKIILRLWGFTRSDDVYLRHREKLEKDLKDRMKQNIVRQQVDKLIAYLPLEDERLDTAKFQTPLRGNDLFTFNNPGMYYKSSNVHRLGKIADAILKEIRKDLNDEVESVTVPDDVSMRSQSFSLFSDSITKNNRTKKQKCGSDSSSTSCLTISVSEMVTTLLKEIFGEKPEDTKSEEKQKPKSLTEATADRGEEDNHSKLDENMSEKATDISEKNQSVNTVRNQMIDVDASIVVNQIRNDLLQCGNDLIKQEALFILMSGEIEKLMFKPIFPYPNWKIPFMKGLLINSMEEFSEYGRSLEKLLFKAEAIEQQNRQREFEARASIVDEEEEIEIHSDIMETFDNHHNAKAEAESNSVKVVLSTPSIGLKSVESIVLDAAPDEEEPVQIIPPNPRTDLSPERYAQYYQSLYNKMYLLLCNLMDTMDGCAFTKRVIDEDYGKENFIKISKIPFDVTTESQLNRPLPPRWVLLCQRMEEVRTQLRDRKAKIESRMDEEQPYY